MDTAHTQTHTQHVLHTNSDRVTLFDGAKLALQELRNKPEFKYTKVAAASSTTEPDWARKCLSLLEVEPGIKMTDVVEFSEASNLQLRKWWWWYRA
jgi:hypothetical protein